MLTCQETGQFRIISRKTQTELKKSLSDIGQEWEVKIIVRGKGFIPRVQRSFSFVEGAMEVESMTEYKMPTPSEVVNRELPIPV